MGAWSSFTPRSLLATALLIWLVWTAHDVLLLVFAGVLLAVMLRSVAEVLHAQARLPMRAALPIAILSVLFLVGAGMYWLGADIVAQASTIAERLPQALQRLREQFGWLGGELERLQTMADQVFSSDTVANSGGRLLSLGRSLFSTTFGVVTSVFVVVVIGLYLAGEPDVYRRGFAALLPKAQRPRAFEVMDRVGNTLMWWMIGQFISMTVVGVLTTIGLSLLGIDLALSLGVLAALLTFIPNIGPVLSAIPAVLLALLGSTQTALYVVLLYVGVQAVESYLITPYVQRRAVALPPALILTAQLLLGLLAGGPGLILATPLAAAGLVLVRELLVRTQDEKV